ncbi:MAG: FixH family protein [Candidatus Saccharicenans sp.]|jgi:hypothetical protein|nr:FixH family protein [Candidatus Saccharicenans sp.]MDH7493981.1 FixH family protein [Candidatus Saccharicenans sp.]
MSKKGFAFCLGLGLLLITLVRPPAFSHSRTHQQASLSNPAEEIPVVKPAGKKNPLSDVGYFIWEFNQTPKMGTVILKVEVYNQKEEKVSHLQIDGRSDMPSMRGHHDSGEVAFKVNNQGSYLLPVNIVMPGDWEVILTFRWGEKILYRGRILFKV